MICGTIFGVTCTYLFSTDHVTMQPKSKILLDLIDSIAISPVKLMHLKVFGCYMHGTLKTWSVHPPQPKPELETRVRTRSHIMEGQQGGHTTADGTFTGAKYKTSLLVTGLTGTIQRLVRGPVEWVRIHQAVCSLFSVYYVWLMNTLLSETLCSLGTLCSPVHFTPQHFATQHSLFSRTLFFLEHVAS